MIAGKDSAARGRQRRTRRSRRAALALGLAALALAGCGRAGSKPQRLTLALPDTVDFDPRAVQDDGATPFLALLYEGLVRFDTTGTLRPAGARDWTVSRTGLTYTFHLRRDWHFEDGSRVTAADCARTLDSLFHIDPPSPARPRFWSLDGATASRARDRGPLGVTAPDSNTLVFKLWAPDRFLLQKLAQPRYAVPTADAAREAHVGHALATGPYRLAERTRSRAVLVRNAAYRGEAPASPDSIVVQFGIPARRAVLGLVSGRLDVLWPAPLGYRERLERETRFAAVEGPARNAPVWILVMRADTYPMARRSSRFAVARGLNRQRAVEALTPYGFPWRTFAPYSPGPPTAPGFDPQAAQAALDVNRRVAGIQVSIQAPMGSPEAVAGKALLGDFGRASVYGELRTHSRATFERELYARRSQAVSILAWRSPTDDPVEGIAEWLLNRSLDDRWAGNLGGLRAPGLDSLLIRALREPAGEGRNALRSEIEARLADELPYVPIVRVRELAYARVGVTGLTFDRYYGLQLGKARVAR